MDNNKTSHIIDKIVAIVFSNGGDIKMKKLVDVLDTPVGQIIEYLKYYNSYDRAVVFLWDKEMISMRVNNKFSDIIQELRKNELKDELSKTALEVIAIILYSGKEEISASEIENIRGVNSNYTLRQLLVRGFLFRRKSGIGYMYSPSVELFAFLGIEQTNQLLNFDDINKRLSNLK